MIFFVIVYSSVSFRIIRSPPPYRILNAELCDYKNKNQKLQLVDFYLLCDFTLETDHTIRYMYSYLNDFHTAKAGFLEFQAYKRLKAQANEIGSLVGRAIPISIGQKGRRQ